MQKFVIILNKVLKICYDNLIKIKLTAKKKKKNNSLQK